MAETSKDFLEKLFKQQQILLQMVIDLYKYMPFVYEQTNEPYVFEEHNKYTIKVQADALVENSILYMLPKYTNALNNPVLEVKFKEGESITYDIYLETSRGTIEKAPAHSLIANRLAIFRVISNTKITDPNNNITIKPYIVLTNNPYYNSFNVSELTVTNQTIFRRMPVYLPPDVENGEDISKGHQFVLYSDYEKLLKRVVDLESKFVVGTKEVKDIVDDLEDGQIYMKVEEIDI